MTSIMNFKFDSGITEKQLEKQGRLPTPADIHLDSYF